VRLLERQQDFSGVEVAGVPALQNPDVDEVAVVRLDGDGHVVLVDEQVVIRRRDLVSGDDLGARDDIVGRAEQPQKCPQVRPLGGSLDHVVSWSSWGGITSGSGGWRSRTLSTRK